MKYTEEELKQKRETFINSFEGGKDTYDIKEIDSVLGVYIKKRLKETDSNASLIDIYIPVVEMDNDNEKKALFVNALYGPESESGDGIRIVDNKINEPINFSLNNCFYNINTEKFFIKDKEINGYDFLDKIYTAHIKPTKILGGLIYRIKFLFLKYVPSLLFKFLFVIFSKLLRLTGRKFEESIYKEPMKNISDYTVEKEEDINFLGYKTNKKILCLYAYINFIFFLVFIFFNLRPHWLTLMFKNNFLALVYVFITLPIVEFFMPWFLVKLSIISRKAHLYFEFKVFVNI